MKKKLVTVCDQEFDPSTNTYRWVRRNEEKYVLEEYDRQQLVYEILRGEMTAEQVMEKWNIATIQTIYSWIGKYVIQNETLSLQPQTDDDMANKSKDDQIRELKASLKQAKKKAELEELRANAYDKMISLAEETFNIPIRKKSGTKQ